MVYGEVLLPGVPAVCCGIGDPPAQLAERRAQYTGILENFSIRRIPETLPAVMSFRVAAASARCAFQPEERGKAGVSASFTPG